jgi:hypothetical protein
VALETAVSALGIGPGDAVIMSAFTIFHVFSYQTTNGDLVAALTTAKEHLNPDGILIFDCWYGPAVLSNKPTIRVKTIEDDA